MLKTAPWKLVAAALVPIALAVWYLTILAPPLVPLPADVKVPYPAATRFLEKVCAWCGTHSLEVVGIGAGLLILGLFFSSFARRYYIWLTVLMSCSLLFTYLSISAPIDRLINAVDKNVPKREIPDPLDKSRPRG